MILQCQCCQLNDSKYTCPACKVKTCSLDCVKLHKSISGCTGKPVTGKFIPKEELTENDLLKDYTFLQEGVRLRESANRSVSHSKKVHQHPLIKQCQNRQIDLKLMPKGMRRHTQNQTKYIHQSKLISWSVQVELLEIQAKVLLHNILETESLLNFIQLAFKSFQTSDKHKYKLIQYESIPIESLHLSMKRNDVAANQEVYDVLSLKDCMIDALKGKLIIEYPCITISLKSIESDESFDK